MDTSMCTPRYRARLRNALALVISGALAISSPALSLAAGPHFGGGGHGGGGHFSAPHFGGGRAFSAPHAMAAPHFAAPSYAAHAAYSGYANSSRAVRVGNYAGRGGATSHYVAPYGHGRGAYGGARGGVPGHYIPGHAFAYRYWNGGYWHGGFWPGIYWGSNFAWFLPAIPAFAAAYWWNSIPYYYYDNVYYTYDPADNGYVVTTPPPADDSSAATSSVPAAAPDASYANQDPNDAAPPPATDAPGDNGNTGSAGPTNPGPGNLFAYPKNGQSDEQQSADRQECAQWASGQTRSDGTGNSMDYQRAMTACLQGRGYSVD